MYRSLLVVVVCCCVTPVRADEAARKKAIAYVQGLQTSTGGFLSMAPQPNIRLAPNLRATSAAVRALHYLGGEIPNKAACAAFVQKCYDKASGGFGDLGPAQPDVFTTAVGVMAVTELGLPVDDYRAGAVKFMTEHAQGFDDIRIAAAGLERLKAKSPKSAAWLEEVRKLQNRDGTFGKGAGQARATGGSIVTLLRLGGDVPDLEAIVKVLRDGQRRDGGFGKEDGAGSDLETSYRVMRCFMMLKARPDADRLRGFVAKCRNDDGGYGMAPGQTSGVNATYFAAIIEHWLK